MSTVAPILGAADRDGPDVPVREAEAVSIPQLVAEVFESARPEARAHLLEPLLRPLGLLSLFGIAGGIFARAKMQGGWPELQIRPEDILAVRASDVSRLVDFVQQVSTEAMDALATIVASSAMYSGSAAAALIVAVLVARRPARPAHGGDVDGREAGTP